MKNRLGESIYLTGFNHFLRSNVEAYRHNNGIVEAGPAVLSLPEKDVFFVCSGSVASQLISIAFTEGTDWALENAAYMYLYQGRPRSATRVFFAGPWKYLGQIGGDVAPGAQSPVTKAAVMTLVLGQVVTCYARIRRLDGRLSEPFTSTFTVGA
jgi:hypothetical protein